MRHWLLVSCLAWIGAAAAEPLVMLASEHTVPKHYADNGQCRGYGVELGLAILREAGFEPEARCLPWARAIKEGEMGKGIMAPVFSHSPERDAIFLFSSKVMDDPVVLVQAAARPFPFTGPQDLAGKRVGTTRASRFSPAFNAAMAKMHIHEDGGPEQRLQMLVAGRLDAAIVAGGMHAVRYNARQAGVPLSELRIVQLPVMLDPNYFAMARSHPQAGEIIRRINGALRRLQNSRLLNQMLDEAKSHY